MVNLSNIRVTFGERVIFDNGNFLLRPGDKVGLVGPNRRGKNNPVQGDLRSGDGRTKAPSPWTPAR